MRACRMPAGRAHCTSARRREEAAGATFVSVAALMLRISVYFRRLPIPGGRDGSSGKWGSELEIESPLVEMGGVQLCSELFDRPQPVSAKHVLDHADVPIVPERQVHVLAGHEIDGHGSADRALHGDAERAPSGRDDGECGRRHGPRTILETAVEAPGPLPRSDPRCSEVGELRPQDRRRATSRGSGRSGQWPHRVAPSRDRRVRRARRAPARTGTRTALGTPPDAPPPAVAPGAERRTAEHSHPVRADTRTSRCSSAGRTCSRCSRAVGRRRCPKGEAVPHRRGDANTGSASERRIPRVAPAPRGR